MVDSNIKKNIILKKDLPSVIGDNSMLTYSIKYRIVSEDKNRVSHWSPIHSIAASNTGDETGFDPLDPENTSIPHTIHIDKSIHSVSMSWTMPSLLILNPTEEQKLLQSTQASIKSFDIYVQWQLDVDNSWTEWTWFGTVNSNNFLMTYPHPSDATHIKVRVQKVTQIKEPFDPATYLITNEQEL